MSSNPDSDQASSHQSEAELSYTLPMRIFGGITWGTMLSLGVGLLLILIPQVPRPGLWVAPALWIGLSTLGITLQWNVARGACPKCGTVQIVPATGKRCPECRSYLKSVNRQVMRY